MARSSAGVLIQVTPSGNADVYRLLRSKITREARTWTWGNKAKTRLKHLNSGGHIDIGGVDGVLVASVFPSAPADLFFLVEKFVGRLVAWFEADIATLNVQIVAAARPEGTRKRVS